MIKMKESERIRWFESICQTHYAERTAGRIPKRTLMDIAVKEFGLDKDRASKIRHIKMHKVIKGPRSDELIAKINDREKYKKAA